MAAEDRPPGPGYSAAMLLRHIPMSLTRMRTVVAEMRDARAGWGACLAIFCCAALALCGETVLRDVLTPEPDFDELRIGWGDGKIRVVAAVAIVALTAAISLVATVFFWAFSRIFGAKLSLTDSAIGVFAGALPQVPFSLALIAIAAVLAATTPAETRLVWLALCDLVVVALLSAYVVVSYSEASGMGVLATMGVQALGLIAAFVLLVVVPAFGLLGMDSALKSLVSLVLG